MTNFYEVLFIVPTSLEEEANKELSEKIKKTNEEKHSSKIVKFEKCDDRKLAYTIQDYNEGRYYLLETDWASESIKELESILSFEKTKVLRFIIDKIEKKVKK